MTDTVAQRRAWTITVRNDAGQVEHRSRFFGTRQQVEQERVLVHAHAPIGWSVVVTKRGRA